MTNYKSVAIPDNFARHARYVSNYGNDTSPLSQFDCGSRENKNKYYPLYCVNPLYCVVLKFSHNERIDAFWLKEMEGMKEMCVCV